MAYCPGCGAVNEGPAKECAACGRVLAKICTNCETHNLMTAELCSKCGKVMISPRGSAVNPPAGEPIAEMLAVPKIAPSFIDRKSVLKAGIGSFGFLFVFLSELFKGHPLITIILGLLFGGAALWGFIDIAIMYMDQMEQDGDVQTRELREPIPMAPVEGIPAIDGSFRDSEKEFFSQDDLYSSMVAVHEEKPPIPTKKAAAAEISEDSGEAISEIPKKPRKAQSLLQFLDEGIAEEIEILEKRLEKSPRNYSLMLKLAQLYEERGELSKARSLLTRCVSLNPENPDIFLFYGGILRRNGEVQEARIAFERALALNRFLSKAHYQLGVLERSEKRLPPAKESLQRCIQLAPDDPYAHYQLGMVYSELGDSGLAEMELKRAVLLNPNDSYGHSQMGQIYQKSRKWDLAMQSFSKALSIKPKDSFVLEKLGEVLLEKGEIEKAREILQDALANQFHPSVKTMQTLAKVHMKMGNMEELKPVVNEILRLVPHDDEANFMLALCKIDQEDFEGALLALEILTKNHPERWEAWVEMAKIYQNLNQPDEALAAFLKAAPSAVDQAGIWNTIGIMLSNKKDYEGSLKAFQKAVSFDFTDAKIQGNFKAVQKKVETNCEKIIERMTARLKKNPQDLPAYLEIGHAYEVLGKPEDALMTYQRLLALKPDEIDGLMAYAMLLRSLGKLKIAIRCFKEVLKLQPEHAEAGIQLVTAYLNQGIVAEALKQAALIQKISPEDPRVHFLLGKIYFAKGLAPRALKEFTFVTQKSTDPDMVGWAELMRRRLTRSI